MTTLTLPPEHTITTLRTQADADALYQHLEDILCCIAGAMIGTEDHDAHKVTESLQEATDRLWLLMTTL